MINIARFSGRIGNVAKTTIMIRDRL